ncbi:tetratricopeptide repeat protein [Oscillatoria amoena NRMC-F 0135]|nr:tetratricopeptide repeat protein [Oscillatoria laete-virens]MDL5046616.1 tetratricopeptide repeat protein [Oscillatoria amoena NRMC-F 0135]MDL5053603.1 tetratricopeptide repeat protein [Oscillatoria laete-virens NRMC-F 0139]
MIKTEHDISPDIKALYLKGEDAAKKDNFDYAIDILQSALVREPAFLKARQTLRSIAAKKSKGVSQIKRAMSQPKIMALQTKASPKKDPLKAMEVAEQILAIDPFNKTGTNILAEAALAADMPETAIFARVAYREGNPGDMDNLFKLAALHISQNEGDKAAKCYEAILKLPGQAANADAIKGMKDATAYSTIKEGNWEDKNKTYKDSLKNQEETVKLEGEAKIYKTDETLQSLIAATQEKMQAEPDNVNHYSTLADLYLQLKDYDTSLAYYKHVYQATGSVDVNLERIMTDIRVKRFNQWIKEREDYISVYPNTPESAQYQSEVEEFKRDRDNLLVVFAKEQVEKYPNDPLLHFNLGEIYFNMGQIDDAQREFQFAQRAPNKRHAALNYLGLCFSGKGMHDLAVSQFQKCISEMPVMDKLKMEICYNLGQSLHSAGKPEEAMEQFKQIYLVDSSYKDVKKIVEEGYTSV